MKTKATKPKKSNELRLHAEAELRKRKKKSGLGPPTTTSTLRLIHELEVHQIELEMQNEELLLSQAETKDALSQYADLYDFAPVGYFTLMRNGVIQRANLAGARIIGVERGKLTNRRFGMFVSAPHRPIFNAFIEKVFVNGIKETCEVRLEQQTGESMWVDIEAACMDNKQELRVVVVDITRRKRAEEITFHNRDLLLALSRAAQSVQRARTPTAVYHAVGDEIKALGYDLMIFTHAQGSQYLSISHTTFAPKLLSTVETLTGTSTNTYQVPILEESVFGRIIAGDGASFLLWTGDEAAKLLPKVLRPVIGRILSMLKVDRGIVAPLRNNGTTMGLLTVTGADLHEGDVAAVEAFAGQVAVSLNNARLSQLVDDELAELTRAEDALRESEARFRLVLENSMDAILLTAPDGSIHSANPAACSMFQMTEQEICSGGRSAVVDVHDARLRILLDERERTGKAIGELTLIRRDGSTFQAEVSTSLFIDRKGDVRTSMIIRDITERKQAEEALMENEALFRSLSDSAPIGIFRTDTAGQCLYTNARWQDLTGLSLQESLGTGWSCAIHVEDRASVFEDWERSIKENREFQREFRFQRPNGEIRWVRARAAAILGGDGAMTGYVGTDEDITARKQFEEELTSLHSQLRALTQHVQKARENERASVAREIHDELGQSLTSIKIDLSWISSKLGDDQGPLLLRAEEMTGLLDELIQKVRTICSDLRPVILDDFGLLAAIEWQMQEFQRRTRIQSEFVSNVESIDIEHAQAIELFRVVQESLTNVVRHAGATEVNVEIEHSDDAIRLTIRDNGIGITPDEVTNPKSLGLLGMQERVRSMNGRIHFERLLSGGTAVTVTAPITSAAIVDQ